MNRKMSLDAALIYDHDRPHQIIMSHMKDREKSAAMSPGRSSEENASMPSVRKTAAAMKRGP
jgi:hypothetical protein